MVRRSLAMIQSPNARTGRCGTPGRNFESGGGVAADSRLTAAFQALAAALDEIPAPSMIIGGLAVIASGVPRQTIDIDATVHGRLSDVVSVVATFARHGITPRIDDALQFARDHQVLLLWHEESGVTIDDRVVRIARPEDLIVYKAAAWRDRDRSDIERLLVLYLNEIDLDRIRGLIAEIAAALEDPRRIDVFDEMVARVRSSF